MIMFEAKGPNTDIQHLIRHLLYNHFHIFFQVPFVRDLLYYFIHVYCYLYANRFSSIHMPGVFHYDDVTNYNRWTKGIGFHQPITR